jgi:putative membrane protein
MYDGWWFWPHGPLFWLVVIAIGVALVVWFVRSPARPGAPRREERGSRGLEVLDERYARGEIGRDEYLAKRRDLTG